MRRRRREGGRGKRRRRRREEEGEEEEEEEEEEESNKLTDSVKASCTGQTCKQTDTQTLEILGTHETGINIVIGEGDGAQLLKVEV